MFLKKAFTWAFFLFKYLPTETLLVNRIINNGGNEVSRISEIEKYNPNQRVVYKNSEINMILYKNKTENKNPKQHPQVQSNSVPHGEEDTVLHQQYRVKGIR